MQYLTCSFEGRIEKKHDDGRSIYRMKGTSLTIDRYGEVVVPRGAVVNNFLGNPVVLKSHDYKEWPVGTVVNLEFTDTEVIFDIVFDTSDPEGQRAERKVNNGTLRASSIGFIPLKWISQSEMSDEEGKAKKEVEVPLPGGKSQKIPMKHFGGKVPQRMFNEWELLEISMVSVPANPAALMTSIQRGFTDTLAEVVDEAEAANPALRDFLEEEKEARLAKFMSELEAFTKDATEIVVDGAVPYAGCEINMEMPWDSSSARAALAKWASKGGSAKKEDMNWAKFSKGFGWFDKDAPEALVSYKLPHHTVIEGKFVGVKRGITAAMASLLGGRSGIEADESKAKVYNHLKRHYEAMGMECPAMTNDYSEATLKAIEDGEYTTSGGVDPQAAHVEPPIAQPPTVEEGKILATLKEMHEKLFELSIDMKLVHELSARNLEETRRIGTPKEVVDPGQAVDKKALTDLSAFVAK